MTTPSYYRALADGYRARAANANGDPQIARRCNRLAAEYDELVRAVEEPDDCSFQQPDSEKPD